MNSLSYCPDTHSLIWYFTARKSLSTNAKEILEKIFLGKIKCFIPTIVLLEAFHVSLKERRFIFPIFLKKLKLRNIFIVSLDKKILSTSFMLPKNLEIHDRVIAATALVNGATLLTKDSVLKKTPNLKTVW